MSVIMTLRFAGDPEKLEQLAAENADMIRGISQRAQERGAIAHRFYGSDGQVMVVDEWPDPESFQAFYAAFRRRADHTGLASSRLFTEGGNMLTRRYSGLPSS